MKKKLPQYCLALILPLLVPSLGCGTGPNHSVARQWNEQLLSAIRIDLARPTVHARNLYHSSVAMYDLWAVFDETAEPTFLGKSLGGYSCPFTGFTPTGSDEDARNKAISYAAYRILSHRFQGSPGETATQANIDGLMDTLNLNTGNVATDYSTGSSAALGNYMAECVINFGLQDGANEANAYANTSYTPLNPPLIVFDSGNPDIIDMNRWQPLTLQEFIDQAGNPIPGATPDFLGPEWGRVTPFALQPSDLTVYQRDGFDYWVYHDPGDPALMGVDQGAGVSAEYQWNHSLVAKWSSHLDPSDGVMWDISPGAKGNVDIATLPTTIPGLRSFYNELSGGDTGLGRPTNPHSSLPYDPNVVPRGDYTRVLAEFWADGPESETPPGHWFVLLNYVSDHPAFVRKYRGQGDVISKLEWDVKAYLAMGGAMHDSAITAWGIKGWYDYIRPVSALRGLAEKGQSSDSNLASYHADGIPLETGYIELVETGDPLAGVGDINVGKIKVKAWRGPTYVVDPATDVAGVGWILADDWWPYQRPSFVTPPFAGYVSGHSTFSRAAAEVMTLLTGDSYFPGGMGEFIAKQNEFLVFEDGPSVDVVLQWATYQDASDQCSLSRIWGGIHPPVDDVPGRLMGSTLGIAAFNYAESFFIPTP